jgi:hypothetical protein
MTQAQITRRLDRIEEQIKELQKRISTSPTGDGRTWRDFVGMFHNDKDFEEAVSIGAAWRESFRPSKKKPKTRKR